MKNFIFPALGLVLSALLLTACVPTSSVTPEPESTTETVETVAPATLSSSILMTPDELTWVDAPASLPAGAKIAVIEEGGLKNPEAFTFRLLLPPNYTLAPHTHPAVEHVTVISGTLYFGEGDEYSADAEAYPAGSVMFMPIGHSMFGFTKDEETIIQIHGVGPWGIEYINAADDPRLE